MSKGNTKRRSRTYLLVLILISVFSACFVSVMGYLNYRGTVISLEESVIARIEDDVVSRFETALSFGKSFETYYGIDEIFDEFNEQIDGALPFILAKDGMLMYFAKSETPWQRELGSFFRSSEFKKALPELHQREGKAIVTSHNRGIFTTVHDEDGVVGYFGALITDDIFSAMMSAVRQKIIILTIIVCGVEALIYALFAAFTDNEQFMQTHKRKQDKMLQRLAALAVMAAGVIIISAVSIFMYQADYRQKIEDATKVSLKNLENIITQVRDNGVDLEDVEGLEEYISARVSRLDTLRAVRISKRIVDVERTDVASDMICYMFGENSDGKKGLYLEAEISKDAMNAQIRGIVLTLLSTLIILLIFVIEFGNLLELTGAKNSENDVFSEHRVAISLRLSGFLCSTAEYMCVPYAAMMIRESGEEIAGLGNGLTAALPLTLEGLTQMIAMLALPRLLKNKDKRFILLISSVMMILCNLGAFSIHSAAAIIAFRAAAGVAYAGFKQISNYLITRGYESEAGRSNNISQDNAGLLAGSTCGAGLGAIICANMGYPVTFFASALLFVLYLVVTYVLMPWSALSKRGNMDTQEKPLNPAALKKMIFSAEMLMFVVFIAIPLNIGVMLCVTLVPAICQSHHISSLMLSYCYIANGIAGIYIGPALVSAAKKKLGLLPGIALSFLLTAAGIFVLKLPAVVVMIVISSMVLGFLDGFGTPLCTDQFMELNVVKNAVDESTALIFSVVISYILLTFSPMIAEAMLLPGEGVFSPMMIGMAVYILAAAVLLVYAAAKKKQRPDSKAGK
ncbi:MAG: MFS transporter [Lachnospiraceae bacterium]|nr:MFS transporter [Lachnospiraceae bacterium]